MCSSRRVLDQDKICDDKPISVYSTSKSGDFKSRLADKERNSVNHGNGVYNGGADSHIFFVDRYGNSILPFSGDWRINFVLKVLDL